MLVSHCFIAATMRLVNRQCNIEKLRGLHQGMPLPILPIKQPEHDKIGDVSAQSLGELAVMISQVMNPKLRRA